MMLPKVVVDFWWTYMKWMPVMPYWCNLCKTWRLLRAPWVIQVLEEVKESTSDWWARLNLRDRANKFLETSVEYLGNSSRRD